MSVQLNYTKWYLFYLFFCNICIITQQGTKEEFYNYGKIIGRELKKLKKFNDYDQRVFKIVDVKKMDKEYIKFNNKLKDEALKKSIEKYFSLDELKKIESKYISGKNLLLDEEINLINGDVKLANIMIDKNKKLYIIDYDRMVLSYQFYDFYYCHYLASEKDSKEYSFAKGVLDYVYDFKYPDFFDEKVMTININTMYRLINSYYEKKEFFELGKFIDKMKKYLVNNGVI